MIKKIPIEVPNHPNKSVEGIEALWVTLWALVRKISSPKYFGAVKQFLELFQGLTY